MDKEGCRRLLGDLSSCLDGEAPAELCAEIGRHLAGCADCRAVVDTLNKTVWLYKRLSQPGLPPGSRERLYATLHLEDFLPRQS